MNLLVHSGNKSGCRVAWKELGQLTAEEAKRAYVLLATEELLRAGLTPPQGKASEQGTALAGPVFSSLMNAAVEDDDGPVCLIGDHTGMIDATILITCVHVHRIAFAACMPDEPYKHSLKSTLLFVSLSALCAPRCFAANGSARTRGHAVVCLCHIIL